jgi:hypothetical protein
MQETKKQDTKIKEERIQKRQLNTFIVTDKHLVLCISKRLQFHCLPTDLQNSHGRMTDAPIISGIRFILSINKQRCSNITWEYVSFDILKSDA